MTYQKIAETAGVSANTAHRLTRDIVISEIGNDRGQTRPSTYAKREVTVDRPGATFALMATRRRQSAPATPGRLSIMRPG